MEPQHANTSTLTHFIEGYLQARQGQLRTAYATGRSLRRMVEKLPDVPLRHLRRIDVANYVQTRSQQGVSDGTINRELLLFSAAINYAKRRWGWDVDNPVPGQYLKWPEGRLRYLTQTEARRLQQTAKHGDEVGQEFLPDFITLALNTGMRKSEMLNLTWDRVRLEERQIALEAKDTKTAKRRLVPLNQQAIDALRSRQQDNETKWVFVCRDGTRPKSIYPAWWNTLERAEIEDFVIHDLRHTFASWLVMSGVSLMVVRDLLGHSSIKSTERYAHLNQDALLAAVGVLDRL